MSFHSRTNDGTQVFSTNRSATELLEEETTINNN